MPAQIRPAILLFERASIPRYQNGFGDGRLNRALTRLRQMKLMEPSILGEALQHDLIDKPVASNGAVIA
jgi:hypothetical protein